MWHSKDHFVKKWWWSIFYLTCCSVCLIIYKIYAHGMQTCTLASSWVPKSMQLSLVNESCSVALLLLSLWNPTPPPTLSFHANLPGPLDSPPIPPKEVSIKQCLSGHGECTPVLPLILWVCQIAWVTNKKRRRDRYEAVLTNIVNLQDLEWAREINIWACLVYEGVSALDLLRWKDASQMWAVLLCGLGS